MRDKKKEEDIKEKANIEEEKKKRKKNDDNIEHYSTSSSVPSGSTLSLLAPDQNQITFSNKVIFEIITIPEKNRFIWGKSLSLENKGN